MLGWVQYASSFQVGHPYWWFFYSNSSSVSIVTIAVGVQGHPPAIDGIVPEPDYKLFGSPTFTDAMSAISTVCLSYAGTPAFFNIVAEMKDQRLYNRSLAVSHSIVTIVYIVCGTVVYLYCGSHVASPALGSAGVLIKKICYGIALPGLIVSEVVLLHVSSFTSSSFQSSVNTYPLLTAP